MRFTIFLYCLMALTTNFINAYKILCAYPTISRSHFIVVDALMQGLAIKGHNVTVISPFPPENAIANYRHITNALSTRHQDMMKSFTSKPGSISTMFTMIPFIVELMLYESESMLTNPEVIKLREEETFDLVIVEIMGEQHMGLAAHFNCPLILFSSVKASFRNLEMLGNPLALSYTSHSIYKLPEPLTFKYRLINMLFHVFEKVIFEMYGSMFTEFHSKHFPQPKYPTLDDIAKNVSAIFVAQHLSQGGIRPLVPGFIEVSGIQMKTEAAPLPEDLQSWMDTSTNGVIYFSLGSNLKISELSPDKLEAIVGAFKKVKLNVLWKSEISEIPELPSNVRLEPWISQNDVLQHKNLKLFITHGGLGSVLEAKFYGVPLVVIPIYADQMGNAASVENEQWGVVIQFVDLTENVLLAAIDEVINNLKYTDKAKYEAMLFRDRPLTPLENAIYWVEYIIRHKGASHMRSNARNLNFFQLHSLDVIGFLVTIVVVMNLVFFKIGKCMWRKIFKFRKHKQS